MGRTYTCLTYHFVFSTKYRHKRILPDFQEELYQYIGGIVRNKSGVLLEIGGMQDHIHIMAGVPPTICISDMLKFIKANSSSWISDHATKSGQTKFSWQPGFGAFTVSHSNKGKLRNYLRNQDEHHRKQTFKAEFLALLDAHGVEYDQKFVFEEEHYG